MNLISLLHNLKNSFYLRIKARKICLTFYLMKKILSNKINRFYYFRDFLENISTLTFIILTIILSYNFEISRDYFTSSTKNKFNHTK